ncbi:ABC transporter G family member 34 [Raphanus sativus]|nr:ABC transporter G family member 34 [Raphanus sativus]
MKCGSQVLRARRLRHHSQKLEYFEDVQGVLEIKDGYNPATWMLDITTPSMESQMCVGFAQLFTNSSIHRRDQKLIKELSTPAPGSKYLYFQTKYLQLFLTQNQSLLLETVLV